MPKNTEQMSEWLSTFGKEYTDRNAISYEEFENFFQVTFGTSRIKLNEIFLYGLDRSTRILEVGSNVGNQLLCLQK